MVTFYRMLIVTQVPVQFGLEDSFNALLTVLSNCIAVLPNPIAVLPNTIAMLPNSIAMLPNSITVLSKWITVLSNPVVPSLPTYPPVKSPQFEQGTATKPQVPLRSTHARTTVFLQLLRHDLGVRVKDWRQRGHLWPE